MGDCVAVSECVPIPSVTLVDQVPFAVALANGTATDPTTAVMAVERAQLSMQLASQLRTKGVEAINDVFHTQV